MTANKQPNLDYDFIIEAIEALKARKARPDKTRICHHLERKRGLLREDVLHALSAAVTDGVVLKVRYKDYYSYRIPVAAASTAHRTNDSEQTGCSSQTADVRLILNTIADELRSSGNSSLSVAQILRTLHLRKQLLNFDETLLETTLRKEVQHGHSLKILRSGKYAIVDESDKFNSQLDKQGEPHSDVANSERDLSFDDKQEAECPTVRNFGRGRRRVHQISVTTEPRDTKNEKRVEQTVVQRARPVSQRKKIRKSLGPDFLDPSALGFQYLHDIYEPRCRYCHLSTTDDKSGKLLSCLKCGYKGKADEKQGELLSTFVVAHISCFTVDNELKFTSNGGWLCVSCNSVSNVCKKRPSKDSTILCNDCGERFQVQCVQIENDLEFKEKIWLCKNCSTLESDDLSLEDATEDDDSMIVDQSPCNSPKPMMSANGRNTFLSHSKEAEVQLKLERDSRKNLTSVFNSSGRRQMNSSPRAVLLVDNKDPMNWSVDEVADFIRDIGFPEQACYFREQEIDGRSLLLMKRIDVLTGLPIKLGPALKIYAHIFQLQGTKMAIFNPFSNDSCEKMGKKKCSAAVSIKLASPSLIPQI